MSITSTSFNISTSSGINEYVDYLLWSNGISVHISDRKENGDERSYLRGIHSVCSLNTIKHFIEAEIPNSIVQTRSTWVDKNPQTYFGVNKNCEIGDLLIVINIMHASESGRAISKHKIGWILQGKTALNPTTICHHDKSTKNEIDLYNNYLNFEVKHFKKKLGLFDLSNDQDINISEKWAFLQFCLNDEIYDESHNWNSSPIQRLCLSKNSSRFFGRDCGSFFDALVQISNTEISYPSKYGLVFERNPEWKRLCEALIGFAKQRNSKLARGPWDLTSSSINKNSISGYSQLVQNFLNKNHYYNNNNNYYDLNLENIFYENEPPINTDNNGNFENEESPSISILDIDVLIVKDNEE